MRKLNYVVNGVKYSTYAEARKIQPKGQLQVSLEEIKNENKLISPMREMLLAEQGYCF